MVWRAVGVDYLTINPTQPIVCSLYARAQRSAARTKPTHPHGTSNRSQVDAHACLTLKRTARQPEWESDVVALFFVFFWVENAQQIRLGKFDGSSRRPLPRTLCLYYYIKIVCIYAVKSHTHLFILLCVMCMGLCLCYAVYGTEKADSEYITAHNFYAFLHGAYARTDSLSVWFAFERKVFLY